MSRRYRTVPTRCTITYYDVMCSAAPLGSVPFRQRKEQSSDPENVALQAYTLQVF